MQAIIQDNLALKGNDIGYLRAEQSTDGAIGCFGPFWIYSTSLLSPRSNWPQYLHAEVMNHPFVDGNKAMGWKNANRRSEMKRLADRHTTWYVDQEAFVRKL